MDTIATVVAAQDEVEPPCAMTAIVQAARGPRGPRGPRAPRETRVLIGDWELSARRARHPSPRIRAQIEYARKVGLAVWCLCTGGRLALVPHAGEKRAPYLSSLRDEAHLHADDCYFGDTSTRSSSGLQDDYRPGQRLESGKILVQLTVPLSSRLRAPAWSTTGQEDGRFAGKNSCPVRVKATPLGMALTLFEEGGLTEWNPSVDRARTWAGVRSALQLSASRVQVGGIALSDRLVLESSRWNSIASSMQAGNQAGRIERAIAIGEAESIRAFGQGYAFRMKDVDLPVYVPAKVWQRALRSFARVAPLLDKPSTKRHVIAVVVLELGADGGAQACRVDLLLTSEHYLPADSRQEVLVMNRLCAQGRWFVRPLFMEVGDKVLPDMILLDCGEPYPMEVFAFWTGDYKQRTLEKVKFYEETGRGYWAWHVETQAEMPAFPSKVVLDGHH